MKITRGTEADASESLSFFKDEDGSVGVILRVVSSLDLCSIPGLLS